MKILVLSADGAEVGGIAKHLRTKYSANVAATGKTNEAITWVEKAHYSGHRFWAAIVSANKDVLGESTWSAEDKCYEFGVPVILVLAPSPHPPGDTIRAIRQPVELQELDAALMHALATTFQKKGE